MKKHTEKPPIDELFARKLGNMSLPPSPDGFERLQARMGQHKPEVRLVFWRNPNLQRYMAAAACLLLVCLFGWLYWPSNKIETLNGQQVAVNQAGKSLAKTSVQQQTEQSSNKPEPENKVPIVAGQKAVTEQVAVVEKTEKKAGDNRDSEREPIASPGRAKASGTDADRPVVAQTIPVKTQNIADVAAPVSQPSANQPVTEQLADNKPATKPSASERVLVVTIAEPEALIAARQAATEFVQEKSTIAASEKLPKESKKGNLWQQVKRIKEGDIFARHDNPANDERGLLGRAYNGIKQSFDKDKSAKQ